jgi:diacylglycerol kinase family enzyme
MAQVGIVINPTAGTVSERTREERLGALRRELEPLVSEEWWRIVPGSDVRPAAEELIARGAGVLFVGGGDGTVNSVVGLAAQSQTALGVLPLGTHNNFARDLGLPLEVSAWRDLVQNLPHRRVDIASVNDIPFVNNASIGIYPGIVAQRESLTRHRSWGKHIAQAVATARVLARLPRSRYTLYFNGEQIARRTPLLFIGNNAYRTGLLPGTRRPTLDAGELWICTARAAGPLSLLRTLLQAMRGRIDDVEHLDVYRTAHLRVVSGRRRVVIAIDGEHRRLESPLVFKSLPRALDVIAPPPEHA